MDTARPLYSKKIHSFLLWMPNWIGDVVLTLPVIQSLRRAYPVARISVVAKSEFESKDIKTSLGVTSIGSQTYFVVIESSNLFQRLFNMFWIGSAEWARHL